ncbi:hypothetical protein OVS_03415 [Mycoplasma ovis str. Michigan]|uniref:Uncharacterized protein n=1 Tax=Mycoplasma ovis str. Michigan TaxID=1415773 RepID=A0ABN4BRS6_9MOLU|nr:hypothetical protein [Mycoplasma ovis]AHC40434.1 hypothetical protein OVS_03415 [Mycoplasma ovis str. Michigan]
MSKSDNGGKLNLDLDKWLSKIDKIRKKATFKEVGMKFGNEDLEENDKLISPAHDGKYYFAKYINDNIYKLENGMIIQRFHKQDLDKYKDLRYINLNMTKQNKANVVFYLLSL